MHLHWRPRETAGCECLYAPFPVEEWARPAFQLSHQTYVLRTMHSSLTATNSGDEGCRGRETSRSGRCMRRKGRCLVSMYWVGMRKYMVAR